MNWNLNSRNYNLTAIKLFLIASINKGRLFTEPAIIKIIDNSKFYF